MSLFLGCWWRNHQDHSSRLSLVKSAEIVLGDYFSHRSQQVVIARQPLFPDSTKEAIVQAESEDFGGWSKHRRDNFAKTAINQTNIVKSKSDGKSQKNSVFFFERKINFSVFWKAKYLVIFKRKDRIALLALWISEFRFISFLLLSSQNQYFIHQTES